MDLDGPVQFVKGIGPARAAGLAAVGVKTVEDLLYHLPLRYEDRRQSLGIAQLEPGMKTSVTGEIAVAGLRRGRRMRIFEIRIEDGTGRLKALWFNQPYLKDVMTRGRRVTLFGTVEPDAAGSRYLMMSSPEYELVEADDGPGTHTGRIVPIYEKLGPLAGKALRRTLSLLVESLPDDLPDSLPPALRERLGVTTRADALRRVHAPGDDEDQAALNAARSPGHRRLILEEFFLFQLGLAERRLGLQKAAGIQFAVTEKTREAVKRILPFHLTNAQKRVLREIVDDMRSPHPMNRLVQGDVGSGKTVVALLSMVVAIENGFQAAFMAPTEILAEQHFLTFRRLLARCPYEVQLLTAGRKGAEKRTALARVASGETQIAVGTHALIQEGVRFHKLGLSVVDEQHRFGVVQREDLIRKGYDVDVIVMTATPIPRTLALSAYGDLDVSVVDELPPGRTPIRTLVRPASGRREVADALRRAIAEGRQAYVVYPLVAESEKLEDVRAATEMAAEWRLALPKARVGLLHGRLKSAEKEDVMAAFSKGAIDLLVSTTVIEVGVDVPNATLMVIEHAERFGLAQLHQLRGRVGRGPGASVCILVTYGVLSPVAKARLQVMSATNDGFVIAEKDLEIRGPGDFFGTRQWGLPSFRVGHLIRDRDLLEQARAEAVRSVSEMSEAAPDSPLSRFLHDGGWERRFGRARVG